jgi:hypothetical protein
MMLADQRDIIAYTTALTAAQASTGALFAKERSAIEQHVAPSLAGGNRSF